MHINIAFYLTTNHLTQTPEQIFDIFNKYVVEMIAFSTTSGKWIYKISSIQEEENNINQLIKDNNIDGDIYTRYF
jgi:V8-like Glu-specific endopeptidase